MAILVGYLVPTIHVLACLFLIGLSTTDAGGPLKHFFHDYFGTTAGAVMFQLWLVVEAGRVFLWSGHGVTAPEV